MMSVPADKHHAEVHGSRGKDKMEKTIPIRYVIFRLYHISELQYLRHFLFKWHKKFLIFIDLIFFSWNEHTCKHL
jgi:hypothetical protein